MGFGALKDGAIKEGALIENSSLCENSASRSEDKLPPMLLQYQEYKRLHPECVILFQVGDFYEIFFEDAVTVAQRLNLTLTTRDRNSPNPVPMCGVPVASLDGYLDRLVQSGFSAAVVSQVNAASAIRLPTFVKQELSSKVAIRRKLTRVVTPGIRIFSQTEEGADAPSIASLSYDAAEYFSVAYGQVQHARLFVKEQLSLAQVLSELSRVGPRELIMPLMSGAKRIDRRSGWVRSIERLLGESVIKFRMPSTGQEKSKQGGSGSRTFAEIPGYSSVGQVAKQAIRLLIGYIDETIIDTSIAISEVCVAENRGVMTIDASTRANLELVRNARDGSSAGTLYEHLNGTSTVGGARLLRSWILEPLTDGAKIQERHAAVSLFKSSELVRERLRGVLRGFADLERICARIELGIAQPRELGALRDGLQRIPEIVSILCSGIQDSDGKLRSSRLEYLCQMFKVPEAEYALLQQALNENLPANVAEGGIIRAGYDTALDHLRGLKLSADAWVVALEAREREATGITSLKVKCNYVLGYFIEVTRSNLARVPDRYERRQSTANVERFTTVELKGRESEILSADEKAALLERKLFEELRYRLVASTQTVRSTYTALCELDVLLALGFVAECENYVQPHLSEGRDLVIEAGRHPILERILHGRFVPNSLEIRAGDAANPFCFVITGPNMGGKSTYLRQVALIVIMAQLGSCVPAREAHIGLVDRIYARLGASDNLSEGESTFMVEMREASHILQGATDRSLLLIDEIGRGTATSDGLAIAQAILEWIVCRAKSRTLFATHFHELTVLAGLYPGISNLSVHSVEQGEEVFFTHAICSGPASKSYGVEVAKLAGLPAELLARARELLLSKNESTADPTGAQLSLFGARSGGGDPFPQIRIPADYAQLKHVCERVRGFEVNQATPLQALQFVSGLQDELGSDEG